VNRSRTAAAVLTVGGGTSGTFNWWHATHHGHMQPALAFLCGAVPVGVALMLSHIGATPASRVLKGFIWAAVVFSMILSANATAWTVRPADGLWAGWLFGITIDLASLVALAVIVTGPAEPAAGTTAGTTQEPPREPAQEPAQKPPRKPAEEPHPTTARDPQKAAQARRAYRKSVLAGTPLSQRDLAARFAMSPKWARDRIAETRDDLQATGTQP